MKNIVSIITLICATLLGSCSLDRTPLDKLSPENFFSSENELQAYSNNFYYIFPSSTIYSEAFDNVTQNILADEMSNGRTVPATDGGWSWKYLRKFNTLLSYSSNCEDTAVRNEYDALARFFRAYFYFDKVKRYGDVPWYSTILSSDDPELMRPRDSREFIMQKMIEDIDFAISYLPRERSTYRVTKWTALALKSRFCLFEGTFRKYHGITDYDHSAEWYLEQAANASQSFINESGYTIYSNGNPNASYNTLFSSLDAIGNEIVLSRNFDKGLGIMHNAHYYVLSKSFGRPGVSRKIVDSYLTSTGGRFTERVDWQTASFEEQCENRDPRLAQTVITPGYSRVNSSKDLAPDLAASVTGYQLIKYLGASTYDAYMQSCSDLPLFRAAEVYLNFAEAKAELGTLTQDDLNKSVNMLRRRVSMPDMNLAAANADPDPYMSSAETGYVNVEGANKGVILEIRRERTIELIAEGFRYYDIMRWREGQAFKQPLYGIYFDKLGGHDLTGDGADDIYLARVGESVSSSIPTFVVGEDVVLTGSTSGYLTPHSSEVAAWDEERDYLYPVPINERTLTQGALSQNPGWNDGLSF